MNVMLSRWGRLYAGTPAERALEPAVAALGVPYRFQHPLFLGHGPGPALRYFPDFVLLDQRVVIEVDDPGHAARQREDAERTRKLEAAGWRVVRCSNGEALRDPRAAVARMLAGIAGPWAAQAAPALPAPGEGAPPGEPDRPRRSRGRRRSPSPS